MHHRIKGNKGLGNGEDPQPPVKDAPGSGPANRSYKGKAGV
jgi:hypothetical protein